MTDECFDQFRYVFVSRARKNVSAFFFFLCRVSSPIGDRKLTLISTPYGVRSKHGVVRLTCRPAGGLLIWFVVGLVWCDVGLVTFTSHTAFTQLLFYSCLFRHQGRQEEACVEEEEEERHREREGGGRKVYF